MPKLRRQDGGCPDNVAAQAIKRLGGRWKILIILRLIKDGATGFNALQRAIPGVSAKMLRQQLVELEDDAILTRHEIVSEPPKTVRYELTPLGLNLQPVVEQLSSWGAQALRQHGY